MGHMTRGSALVYRIVKDGDKGRLEPIGTAFVGEDGRTLAIEIDQKIMVGPETPLVVRRG